MSQPTGGQWCAILPDCCVRKTKAPTDCGGFSIRCSKKADLLWHWPNQHDHLAAFHLGKVLHPALFFGVLGHTLKQFTAQILVCHLAAPETQGDLDLVAVLQKLVDVAHFDIIVVGVRVRTELDLFDLDDLLLLARFGFAFLGLVFEFTEIHDLADRRTRVWRNLNQIKTCLYGQLHSAGRRNNTAVSAVSLNQANFV